MDSLKAKNISRQTRLLKIFQLRRKEREKERVRVRVRERERERERHENNCCCLQPKQNLAFRKLFFDKGIKTKTSYSWKKTHALSQASFINVLCTYVVSLLCEAVSNYTITPIGTYTFLLSEAQP
jgi:hypothetical protein